MTSDFKVRKRLIVGALALLALADVGLIAYAIQNAGDSGAPQLRLAQEARTLKLLRADVERAQKIRKEIPAIQADCEKFERSMAPSSAAYSTVVAELGETAKKAGVRMEGVTFHETQISDKPFSQIGIEATVEGPYANVVRFLNGLQTSSALYIVNELGLASGTQNTSGSLHVSVRMATYFRTKG